jgi:hypothetical protein
VRFEVNEQDLSLTFALDQEPAGLDLTRAGLGSRILDAAVEGMLAAHARRQSPDGRPWPPLAASTARQKGHADPGVRTGAMLDPLLWVAGRHTVGPRRATWQHPAAATGGREKGKILGFHRGDPRRRQPPRPLLGWTAQARAEAEELIRAALEAL